MLPKLIAANAVDNGVLRLTFKGGTTREVKLSGLIARSRYLSPLAEPSIFQKVRVIDRGAAAGWPDGIEISAGLLWRIVEEQSRFDADVFNEWQRRMKLSNQEAADALGIALSTLKSMKSGETKISSAVAIACRAMEAEPAVLAAHFHPRRSGRPRVQSGSSRRRHGAVEQPA